MPVRITLAIVVVVATLLLPAGPAVGAQGAGSVEQCTNDVSIRWNGVVFDPADADPGRSDWFVDHLETVSQGEQCAGFVQSLTLLDGDREVLFSDSVVLDGQGNGSYQDVDVRVEDVMEVQVLLSRETPLPTEGGETSRTDALPRTGADVLVIALVGALFMAVGFALKRRPAPA